MLVQLQLLLVHLVKLMFLDLVQNCISEQYNLNEKETLV